MLIRVLSLQAETAVPVGDTGAIGPHKAQRLQAIADGVVKRVFRRLHAAGEQVQEAMAQVSKIPGDGLREFKAYARAQKELSQAMYDLTRVVMTTYDLVVKQGMLLLGLRTCLLVSRPRVHRLPLFLLVTLGSR